MNLSQLKEVVWHGWGPDAGPCQAGDHRSEIVSSVEAVLELGEVARHMFTADGAIGANNGGFDIAQSRVDPLESRSADRPGAGAGYDDLVRTPGVLHAAETLKTVADHWAARIQAALGEDRDLVAAKTGDAPHFQADWLAFRRGLHRRYRRRLFLGASGAV